eukprot:Em0002g415a
MTCLTTMTTYFCFLIHKFGSYYVCTESTFLVKSGSFDGSQPSQMHLYGVFTSPSFGPVGSAVCVFNYVTMANVFHTSSFVVRDTTTLVFNSATGASVDVTDVCISNGMAWSPGNTKMYHMDSGLRKLWSFNVDDVTSCLTNRQATVLVCRRWLGGGSEGEKVLFKSQLMADKPLNIATRYFTIFPDHIIPVGTVSGVVMGRRLGILNMFL